MHPSYILNNAFFLLHYAFILYSISYIVMLFAWIIPSGDYPFSAFLGVWLDLVAVSCLEKSQ